jgi:Tfp pilus assembly protein PilZ
MIRSTFRLQFESAGDLQKAFTKNGDDVGMFFHTGRDLPLGERVVIKTSVKDLPSPLYLEGHVAWRRLRPRGSSLPRGLFVALSGKEKRRLADAVAYLNKNTGDRGVREHSRFPVFVKAHYRTDRGIHPAITRDISIGGAFLQCKGPLLPVGSKTEVTLNLQWHKRENIELLAEVVRFDPLPESLGLAVRFKPGQPGLKKLSRFLDGIQSDLNVSTVAYNQISVTA